MDRFLDKIGAREKNKCWKWIGALSNGYGIFWANPVRKYVRATQFSWEIYHGKPFPRNQIACHSCDNRKCVNPEHIFAGSYKDNTQDCIRKGRFMVNRKPENFGKFNKTKTHCKRGHELTPENTQIKKSGYRNCRICNRMLGKKYDFNRRHGGQKCQTRQKS